ncbi:MAG: hypothetical protein ACYDDF_02875 [Thermoplasmatota archaeon]
MDKAEIETAIKQFEDAAKTLRDKAKKSMEGLHEDLHEEGAKMAENIARKLRARADELKAKTRKPSA